MAPVEVIPAPTPPLKASRWALAGIRALRRPQQLALASLAGALAVLVGSLVIRSGSSYDPFWDAWVPSAAPAIGAAMCFARAAEGGSRRAGAAWLGVAMLLFTVGNAIYLAWTQFQPDPSGPAFSGLLFVLVYPCIAVGMVRLIGRDGRPATRALALDAMLGAVGVATALCALLGTLLAGTDDHLSEVLVGGDLLLIGVACGVLVMRGLRPGPMWSWMVAGLVMFFVADISYAWRSMVGVYQGGTVLESLWAIGLACMAVALWRRDTVIEAGVAKRSEAVLVVPLVATLIAASVLILSSLQPFSAAATSLSTLTLVLATLTLLLAALRTFVSFRHVWRLTDALAVATTDDLTGLGNRRALFEQGSDRLAAVCEAGSPALLLIDLDDFREVNDTLGHDAGDQLLRVVAGRLSAVVKAPDVLVRLGGDEFAVAFCLDDGADSTEIARNLLAELSHPVMVNGLLQTRVAASAGVAESDGTAASVAELLRRAEVAMYAAKSAGSLVERYRSGLDEAARLRIATIDDLDHAFVAGEFIMHFQPKIELATGRVSGAEALVRWQHPTRGLLFPDAFLDIVEDSGRMSALTRCVLEVGIRQIAAWRDVGIELPVAVNLSATDLLDDGLTDRVVDLLAEHSVPPNQLVLEITESVLMTDRTGAVSVLAQLRAAGVRISVDDYGTGYCSLAYLRDLPVDELKIDRSFVDHADGDVRSAAIVRSTIGLAHALGLKVVAEGVERDHTRITLTQEGCDEAQGYFFSRPVSAAAFAAWYHERDVTRAARAA